MKTAISTIQLPSHRGFIYRMLAMLLVAVTMTGMLVTPACAASMETASVAVGSTTYLSDKASYSLAGASVVANDRIWESSNPRVADVIKNNAPSCQIKGMSVGTAIISCTTYVTIYRTNPITKRMEMSYVQMMGSTYEVTVTESGSNAGGNSGGSSTYMKTDPQSLTFNLASYSEQRVSLEISSKAPSNYPQFQSSNYVTVRKSQSSFSIYNYTLTVGLTASASVGDYTAEAVLKNSSGTIRDRISIPIHVTCSHSYGNWTVTKEATCSEEGQRTRRCGYCGDTRTETIPITGHDVGTKWLSNASQHWKECTSCGQKSDTADHTWDGGVITEQPNYNREGVKLYTCAICGATKTESLPRTGNSGGSQSGGSQSGGSQSGGSQSGGSQSSGNQSSGKSVPRASFSSTSLSGVKGKTAWNRLSTNSTGRITYVSSDASVATVSSTGRVSFLKAGTATITATVAETWNYRAAEASYTVTVTEPNNAGTPGRTDSGTAAQKDCRGSHSYDQGVVREKATCSTAGEIVYTCVVCGKTRSRMISPTFDHHYDAGVVTKQPEGWRSGRITYTCVDCGHTKTRNFYN